MAAKKPVKKTAKPTQAQSQMDELFAEAALYDPMRNTKLNEFRRLCKFAVKLLAHPRPSEPVAVPKGIW